MAKTQSGKRPYEGTKVSIPKSRMDIELVLSKHYAAEARRLNRVLFFGVKSKLEAAANHLASWLGLSCDQAEALRKASWRPS